MAFNLINQMAEYIWINGDLVRWGDANIHLLTHSLHYGGAVFEGERSYGGKIFKLEQHTERLLKSAESMCLNVTYTQDELNKATKYVLEKNNITDAYIRPLVWRGAESLNIANDILSTNVMILVVPSKPEFQNGLNLNISNWRKPHPLSFPSQAKSSAHYAMATVAKTTAKEAGYDDSLVLDLNDNVAECTVTNIFFIRGDELFTPVADIFLNGITRQTVIQLAHKLGVKTTETRIHISEIDKFDGCFITGTAAEIKSVYSIQRADKKIIFENDGIVKTLQQEYAKLVGKV